MAGVNVSNFDPDTKDFPKVKDEIEKYVKNLNQSGTWKSQNMSTSSVGSNEVSYTFYSENLDKLYQSVDKVEKVMKKDTGLKDVTSSAEDPFVEYTFKVEQNDLIKYGLTTGQLVMMLNPTKTQDVLTTIEKNGESLDVIVQQEQSKQPESIDEMLKTPVPTAMGTTVPLSQLVTVKKEQP